MVCSSPVPAKLDFPCDSAGLNHSTSRLRAPTPVFQDRDNREFIHRINAEDRICFLNDAWLRFAEENDWRSGAERVLGTPIMSQIADPETRHIYRLLIDRAREGARTVRFPYRCDSPAMRRFMEMRVSSTEPGTVEFRSRVLRLEPREPIRLLEPGLQDRRGDSLQICSWCKSICAGSAWIEVEDALQSLRILAAGALPQLSHGICPSCSHRMTQAYEAL